MKLIVFFLICHIGISNSNPTEHGISKRSTLYTCKKLSEKMAQAVMDIKRDNQDSIDNFQNICCELKTCFEELGSPRNSAMIREGIKKTESICVTSGFIYGEFNDCMLKLIEKNTKCFQGWTPLNEIEDRSVFTDPVKFTQLKKEMCANVFGKEKCMKKEIMETCGLKDWVGAKKYVPELVRVSTECDVGVL